jgi:hypothetical protein
MSKPTSIDAGRQLINQASDEGRCMEARPATTNVQEDFSREFLVFQKPMTGRSLQISPTLV